MLAAPSGSGQAASISVLTSTVEPRILVAATGGAAVEIIEPLFQTHTDEADPSSPLISGALRATTSGGAGEAELLEAAVIPGSTSVTAIPFEPIAVILLVQISVACWATAFPA